MGLVKGLTRRHGGTKITKGGSNFKSLLCGLRGLVPWCEASFQAGLDITGLEKLVVVQDQAAVLFEEGKIRAKFRVKEDSDMDTILTDFTVSISVFKKNPAKVLREAGSAPVTVLSHIGTIDFEPLLGKRLIKIVFIQTILWFILVSSLYKMQLRKYSIWLWTI
jgi:hypothetical protein